jgi:hypothetical protein
MDVNPSAYASDSLRSELPKKASGMSVRWSRYVDGELWADVRLGGRLIAQFCAGAKPGWALDAKKDGPLARVLVERAIL